MNIRLRAANYIMRYAPSQTRLEAYLTRKKCDNIPTLLAELGYDETMMIQMWMRTFIAGKKGKQEMIRKLRAKAFPRELIEQNIEAFSEEWGDFDEYRTEILSQIDTYRARHKSRREISALLYQKYPYFRDQIGEIIGGISDDTSLDAALQKYAERYDLTDRSDTQKVIAALVRKGFQFSQVRDALKNFS